MTSVTTKFGWFRVFPRTARQSSFYGTIVFLHIIVLLRTADFT